MSWDKVTQEALPSSEVTHLHLVRHGRVETGGRRLVYGHSDLPLSPRGRRDHRAMVPFALEHIPRPLGVWASDLSRCLDLGQRLAQAYDVPFLSSSLLREQFMGSWEGRAWSDLTAADEPAIQAYWDDYATTAPPGGESLLELSERVSEWWDAHEARLLGGRWVVVTHIGVIRALCCQVLGLPVDQALRLAPARASHTHLLVADTGGVIEVLGEHPRRGSPTPKGRPPRVAITGSAGTGKTTLGRTLASELELPFLEEGMRARLQSGLNVHELTHSGFRDLVMELWDEHRQAEAEAVASAGGFVADRSSLDFAAFWLTYNFSYDQEATTEFFSQTLGHAPTYDRVVVLPWGVLPLRADGVRVPNPWIQRHFQATVEGLVQRELDPARVAWMPALRDLEQRVQWVLDELS